MVTSPLTPLPLRILVADDSVTIHGAIKLVLEGSPLAAAAELSFCDSGTEALALLCEHRFDLFITDLNMPGLGGLEVIRGMAADPRLASLPLVVLSAQALTEALDHAGPTAVVRKLEIRQSLHSAVAAVLTPQQPQARHDPKPSIIAPPVHKCIIADDDPLSRKVMGKLMTKLGYAVTFAGDGMLALEILQHNVDIDILLTDQQMPRMTGMELVRIARQNPQLSELGIAMVSGVIRVHEVSALLENGADRFVPKPVDHKLLVEEIKSLQLEVRARKTRPTRKAS